jgi:myo-inositol-1(or 4)-monophosphatase
VTTAALTALDARLQVAREAALEAGRFLAASFRQPVRSHFKRGDSMVSEVDQAAEDLLKARIRAAFPGDSILGEESGYEARDPDWCWTLDPLDGTQNFLAGLPLFVVAVAVLWERQPAVAVIHDPLRGEVYAAVRGRGARRDGVAIAVASGAIVRSSVIAVRHRFLRREAERLYDLLSTRKYRSLGTMALELAYTAAGGIDLLVADRPHLWDVAPGVLLVEEAGGKVCGFGGEPLFPLGDDPRGVADRRFRLVAGAAPAVEQAVTLLRTLPL